MLIDSHQLKSTMADSTLDMELARLEHELQKSVCQDSFEEFVKYFWPVIDPRPLVMNWHISAICQHMQSLYDGTLGFDNLLINVPPGSGKSLLMCMFCLWVWSKDPSYAIISAAGAANVSSRDSLKARGVLESPNHEYQQLFDTNWKLTGDQNEKLHFSNTRKGFRQAVTVNQKITGARANCLLIDDPNDLNQNTRAERAKGIHWYSNAFANRTILGVRTIRILIQQRVSNDDLTGWIQQNEAEQWCQLIIPQEFDPKRKCVTPIWSDPRTEEGQLLFPQFTPKEKIDIERKRLGSSGYASQHQQLAVDSNGEIFKVSDETTGLPYKATYSKTQFDEAISNKRFTQIIISIDPATKGKETNDPSGFLIIGKHQHQGYWILDNRTKRTGWIELKGMIKDAAAHWQALGMPVKVLFETNVAQGMVQEIRSETNYVIVEVTKSRDKVSYAQDWSVGLWEQRLILISDYSAWTQSFLDELYAFKMECPHDDQVDAMTQGLNYLTAANDSQGYMDYMADLTARAKQPAPAQPPPNFNPQRNPNFR